MGIRRRRGPLIVGIVAVALVLGVAGARALSERAAVPTPTPTAAALATATPPSPSSAPSPTTASPSPASTRRYVSAAMGYSIELRDPWHRANCGSSTSGPIEGRDGVDVFVAIPERDIRIGDVGGIQADAISVVAGRIPTA